MTREHIMQRSIKRGKPVNRMQYKINNGLTIRRTRHWTALDRPCNDIEQHIYNRIISNRNVSTWQ